MKGDTTMGNAQEAGNAIKTDTGEKRLKSRERRLQVKKDEPIYEKRAVSVKTVDKKEPTRSLHESVQKDIERMKRMASYNEKTQ